MIKTRLVRLLSHAKKYIAYNVFWQWMAMLVQVMVVWRITDFFGRICDGHIIFQDVILLGIFLIVALVCRFFFDRMAASASYHASVDVKRILREKIYDKLLRLGASYKEKVPTSEIVQMSSEGVEQLEIYFGKYLPQLFYSLLAPLTLFIILCTVSVKASLVLLICVPLIPISIVVVQKIAKRLLGKYWGIYADLGDVFLENLQGLTTLKIYEADQMKSEEMDAASQRFRKITMKVLTMQLNSTSVMDIVAYGGAAVGMAVSAAEYMAGHITLAQALMIILLASEFFIPLRILGSFFHIAMNGMAASDKIFAFLDMEEAEKGKESFVDGNIIFKDVCFSYDKDRRILKDVNLLIPKGNLISLVGESGCGKSTIAGILAGKNRGYEGEILIGGQSLDQIREEEILSHVTLVSHDSYLFKGTVEENLRMASPDALDEELIDVLCKTNLWEYLKTQGGLKTKLLEKGINFSGGQRQRLALARALLHDTPIYIFDEATSNIDAESEEMIMDVIRLLAQTRTVLLISHRLSNVVESDMIYLLKEGQIVEAGTHDQLIELGKDYYTLYRSQKILEEYGMERNVDHES